MRPQQISMTLTAPDDDGVFADQTTGGAGSITLDGAEVVNGEWLSPDGTSKKIDLTSGGNVSAVMFTITGFEDVNRGIAVTETIAGPNANTVTTTNYFAVITEITVDAAVASATKGGANADGESVSPIIPVNWRGAGIGIEVLVSGTIEYSVQQTFDFIQQVAGPFNWLDHSDTAVVSATTSQLSNYDKMPRAVRLEISSFTDPATARLTLVQEDNS